MPNIVLKELFGLQQRSQLSVEGIQLSVLVWLVLLPKGLPRSSFTNSGVSLEKPSQPHKTHTIKPSQTIRFSHSGQIERASAQRSAVRLEQYTFFSQKQTVFTSSSFSSTSGKASGTSSNFSWELVGFVIHMVLWVGWLVGWWVCSVLSRVSIRSIGF